MKRIGLVVGLLTSALAGGSALADPYDGAGVRYRDHREWGGDRGGPAFVGEAHVGGWRSPGVLGVDHLGRVDRLVLVARDGVLLRGVRLTYGNGETQLADVRGFFPAGARTSIDIPGPGRRLRTIELIGGGARRGRWGYNNDGAAGVVRVFAILGQRGGWHGNGGYMGGGGYDENAAWQPLGAAACDGTRDRETIDVAPRAYRQLMLAGDAGLQVAEIAVTFTNGQTVVLPGRALDQGGVRNQLFDLPADAQPVARVSFRAGAYGNAQLLGL